MSSLNLFFPISVHPTAASGSPSTTIDATCRSPRATVLLLPTPHHLSTATLLQKSPSCSPSMHDRRPLFFAAGFLHGATSRSIPRHRQHPFHHRSSSTSIVGQPPPSTILSFIFGDPSPTHLPLPVDRSIHHEANVANASPCRLPHHLLRPSLRTPDPRPCALPTSHNRAIVPLKPLLPMPPVAAQTPPAPHPHLPHAISAAVVRLPPQRRKAPYFVANDSSHLCRGK